MNPNITIVTAIFDIGRGEWPENPPYLRRTLDTYFERFEHLLKLNNRIVVHTSRDLEERFRPYQYNHPNLTVVGWEDWRKDIWPEFFEPIDRIQNSAKMRNLVQQPWNPEYWSVDYVMVNMMKSYFVNYSIEAGLVDTDLVAWLDFGYCREASDVPNETWNCQLSPDKIHLFSVKNHVPQHMTLSSTIATNDVWITGCHIVASKSGWKDLLALVYSNLEYLIKLDLIDDDQTVLYMSYCTRPELFQINYIDPSDWFCVMRKFNNG